MDAATTRRAGHALGLALLIAAVSLSLLSPETARAQSPVSEVRDSGGNTLMTVFDNGELEVTGGYLLPDGTLLDDSGDLGGLSLPFSGSASASDPLLELIQNGAGGAGFFDVANSSSSADALTATTIGTGHAGEFKIFNTSSDASALFAQTDGSGNAMEAVQTGSGRAGHFQTDNSSNPLSALRAESNGVGDAVFGLQSGTGRAGEFSITNSNNDASALRTTTAGTGPAGSFEITNSNSGATALSTRTNGNGIAGFFEIDNSANSSAALVARTNGGGPAVSGVQFSTSPAINGFQAGTGSAGVFENSAGNGLNTPTIRAENGSTTQGIAGAFVTHGSDATVVLANRDGGGDLLKGFGSNGGNREVAIRNNGEMDFFSGGNRTINLDAPNGDINIDGSFNNSGADFAEELPVASSSPHPSPKDLIGVRGGTVSLRTENADRLMIVSSAPAVTGNTTPAPEADDARRVPVAFIGQVPTNVRGKAKVGDLIIASGRNDGTARAIAPSEYRRAEHGPIAGKAWAKKTTDGVGTVTVAVGLDQSGALAKQLQEQKAQMKAQQTQISDLKAENEQIKTRLATLEAGSTGASVLAGLPGSGFLLGLLIGGVSVGAFLLGRRRT